MNICSRAAVTCGALEASSELSLRPEEHYFCYLKDFSAQKTCWCYMLEQLESSASIPFSRRSRSLQIQLQLPSNPIGVEQSGYWATLNQNPSFDLEQFFMISYSLWLTGKTDTAICSLEPIPAFRDTVHIPALYHSPFRMISIRTSWASKCLRLSCVKLLLSSVSFITSLSPVALPSTYILEVTLQLLPQRVLSLGIDFIYQGAIL